jgi:hypothetical protein
VPTYLLREGDEVEKYEALKQMAIDSGQDLAELVKKLLKEKYNHKNSI